MKRKSFILPGFLWLMSGFHALAQSPVGFQYVNFSRVEIHDPFWTSRMDKVATVTLPVCIDQTEVKTPRIRNFEAVAAKDGRRHQGIFYDDSDVFKALEAIAYAIKMDKNPGLESKADEWIEKIAAAQLPDGYLNTYYTLNGLDKRWTDMSMHEDYNLGHMIEAGVAYFDATGKRKLLDVCIRMVDHFASLFGPGKRHWVTGHQELELALVKLYHTTSDRKYLDLANWLLEERGHGHASGYTWTEWKDTAYAQDDVPLRKVKDIKGHAVRAMYYYTGAADVAAITGDQEYLEAMKRVWEDVVFRNMYITGGIGASGSNEGFTKDYDLPNDHAYCETCASVGMVFWNQRMNALTGEAFYADVLERSLFNGALDGISYAGDQFFYGNVLASSGQHKRRDWFGTACCPANIARLLASLGNYIYSSSDRGIWIQQYISSNTVIPLKEVKVPVQVDTKYPYEGKVSIILNNEIPIETNLYLRIPGWARGEAVPGGLYRFLDPAFQWPSITVNGVKTNYTLDKGYAVLHRQWKGGDRIMLDIPMPVQRVVSDSIRYNEGKVALQRGPLVYCVEGADHEGKVFNSILPDRTAVKPVWQPNILGGTLTLEASVPALQVEPDSISVKQQWVRMTAIPYFNWANRGQNEMRVWLPRRFDGLKVD
ncbi:MAG TPA: glycoside hydrolase family 127 protein [Saprospiraceae bacterium]|nr:glycoside hydrolase family 127 protein [Saprospiraceae bacterium]HNT21911.1 glycoside hydrolase family 127 protein [Saprospiraceae bacterium]